MKTRLLLLALAASAAACSSSLTQRPDVTRINPKTGAVETRTDVKEIEAGLLKAFPDIPIPAKHGVNLEKSMIFTSPRQTVGKLTTEGKGDANSIYEFYATQMQNNGWSLVNSFQSETSSLYFSKPGHFAAIIIESTGSNSSRVTLNVGPE